LRQVLLNLLNNAVKFTRSGHVEVIAERAEGDDQRSCMRLSVTDTGIGISRDKQDRLFKRFSQVDGSIGKEFGGTGLGLAISKRLIEAMDGRIRVESQEGVGSTFSFDVPLTPSGKNAAELQSPVENSPVSHARVLVADDTEMNQEITTAMLVGAGYSVDIAQDGLEAVRAASTRAYDLILMDVQMPGMDGLTATAQIRELGGSLTALPIIAITANVLPKQIDLCRAAGMSDHLCKPFNRADLLQKVRAWLPAIPGPTPSESAQALRHVQTRPTLMKPRTWSSERWSARRTHVAVANKTGARNLEQLLEAGSPKLAENAHRLAAHLGMLGFGTLSNKLKELEAAGSMGSDITLSKSRRSLVGRGICAGRALAFLHQQLGARRCHCVVRSQVVEMSGLGARPILRSALRARRRYSRATGPCVPGFTRVIVLRTTPEGPNFSTPSNVVGSKTS
jgi:CheY-like chemotaxis protein